MKYLRLSPPYKRRKERLAAFNAIDLYPVTCEAHSRNRSDYDILELVISGGAKIIQLRDKCSSDLAFYEKAVVFREVTKKADVLLIINDRADVAAAVDADGIHLGQDDLPLDVARNLLPEMLIGTSTHSLLEALAAEKSDIDYINIGPVFSTKTKEECQTFLGTNMAQNIIPKLGVPFTMMGGITLENLEEILAIGAKKVAVITGITKADDITETVKEFRRRIQEYS